MKTMTCKHSLLICLTTFLNFCACDHLNYERIITEQIKSSINYKYRTNASQFEPVSKTTPTDFGEYDFIVVGGGSTGAVIASSLSEVENWRTLLLEAGSFGNASTKVPALWPTLRLSDYNWGFRSVPQRTACLDMPNRRCDYSRGQALGGTSVLNSLVYARGNQYDFDQWARKVSHSWSFDQVLSYFTKSEDFRITDKNTVTDWDYHATLGRLSVEQPVPRHPLVNVWMRANREKGYKRVDYNGRRQSGFGVVQTNTNHGQRADVGNTFLKFKKNRTTLTILSGAYVTKILIEQRRATGVKFSYGGKFYAARTRKEVILSAGTFNSPQILMLSGIGPKEHLTEMEIETIADLQVGSKLRDQATYFGLSFTTNYTKPQQSLRKSIKQFLQGKGPLTTTVGALGYYTSKFTPHDYPNIELVFSPKDTFSTHLSHKLSAAQEKLFQNLKPFGTFDVHVTLLHPESEGTVKLKSANPFDYPLIDPNLLSDPSNHDIHTLYKALKLTFGLLETRAFARIDTKLVKQGTPECLDRKYLSKHYWYCVLRHFTGPAGSPVGTCRMGPSPEKGDVVDSRNRVHGIGGLRVADASVIPFGLSGRANAVCVMIGEKVADQLKIEYPFL